MNKALLPKVAKPLRYQVKLDVDLDSFNYKGSQTVELEIIEEESKNFKPKPWWAYGLFYCYLLFYAYIFWMEPLKITG